MANLKICIFTETFYPDVGGGETQALQLSKGLVSHGFSVVVLTRHSNASFKKNERLGSVMVYRLPPVGDQHFKKWGLLLTGLPLLIKLRRQYDLIFVSGFRVIGISAVLISRLLRKACILKADSLGEMSGDFFSAGLLKFGQNTSSMIFKLLLSIRNKILKHANSFIAISSDVKRELLACGVNFNIIKNIPNSVDTNKFYPVSLAKKRELRRKLDIPSGDKVIIFTGRLVSYKGLPLLLTVWQEIQKKHSNLILLLVGSGGIDIHNCEEQLKDIVDKNGLGSSVKFTGNVNNVNEYLQASDIFIFPTENEAFGISLIEAMACGLPSISTRIGGVKDILQNQKNGMVINPGNFQQLFEALDLLLTDSALSIKLGKAARQTVQVKYSSKIVIKDYIELFKNVFESYAKTGVLVE